jgi:3-oxoacyl-[acyl-carrier protein] reductase
MRRSLETIAVAYIAVMGTSRRRAPRGASADSGVGNPPVSVVTGAASGIGRRLVSRLVDVGHRVLATDVNDNGLSAAAREDRWRDDAVRTHPLDVRDASAWERVLDAAESAFGPVDHLLNVAGYLRPAWVTAIDPVDVDRHYDINVKGVVLGTHAAAKRMVNRGRGHIINIGSLASLAPVPGLSLYSSSKFAVRGFSLAAAQELRAKGVAVSVVLPDAVQTPMLDLQVDYEEAALTFSGTRALTADEVASAVLRVMDEGLLELALPSWRGWIARAANLVPESARGLAPLLRTLGRRKQNARRTTRA